MQIYLPNYLPNAELAVAEPVVSELVVAEPVVSEFVVAELVVAEPAEAPNCRNIEGYVAK